MLVLERSVRETIVEHALAGRPAEVCGILGGSHGETASHARTAVQTENVAANPRVEYEIGPEEQFAVMEAIENGGADVVGFYHSHPSGPPRPSGTDAARATWPGYSYVIVDLGGTDPEVGAWRWTGATFEEEEMQRES